MRPLQRGDTGDEVKALQRILKRAGLFRGAIGGNFLDLTEEAVVGFQRLHNGPGGRRLPATGIVTAATWWALQHFDESRTTPPTLRRGDRGDDVKALQRLLRARGVFRGAVRGNFLDLTEQAVIEFQSNHAGPNGEPLTANGVAEENTWWGLLHPDAALAAGATIRPTLRFGDRSEDVKELQRLLKKQGFFKGAVKGNFLTLTREAVHYFQETHLGPDGHFLEADGVVGPATWWALDHPSGPSQKSNLAWEIPTGLTPMRQTQLELVLRERAAGVREIPDGSNWGGGVERYGGSKGAPWCCYFWSWATKQCFGSYPLGARYGRCMSAWKRAESNGLARNKGEYLPLPGDAFVMLYRDEAGRFTGRGHIGFVLRVDVANGRATSIDTVEGNAGNRVKVGHRVLSGRNIVGFINQFPATEQPVGWATGLGKTDVGGRDTTR